MQPTNPMASIRLPGAPPPEDMQPLDKNGGESYNDEFNIDEIESAIAVDAQNEEILIALGNTIQTKADQRCTKRSEIERRWMSDLRRYKGIYDTETENGIKESGGSRAFLKLTRPKTDTFSARVADKVLPTDGRNWDLKPSPVPEIENALGNSYPVMDISTGAPMQTEQGAQVLAKDVAKGMKEEAEKRCTVMRDKVDDLLQESQYNAHIRDAIDDMAIYGTGILKGPTLVGKICKQWNKVLVQDPNTGKQKETWKLELKKEASPGVERVSPWDFYPDDATNKLKNCNDTLERIRYTQAQMSLFRNMPGAIKKNIDDLLKLGAEKATGTSDQWVNEMRAMVGLGSVTDNTFTVWLYHGPLTKQELAAAGMDVSDNDAASIEAVAWVCQGKVLKAIIQPMATGERPYSMFYCIKDDTSIWGYGYPNVMENIQDAANGVWRMTIDNAGYSVAPMMLINDKKIEPVDSVWAITPRKIWRFTDEEFDGDPKAVFSEIKIESNVAILVALLDRIMGFADDETNLPKMAQGSEGANPNETLGQSQIRLGAHDVVMRRTLSSIDDDLTATMIPRFVNWLMEYWDNEEAKGDYNLIAQGARMFMESQQQATAVMQLMQMRQDPEVADMVDVRKIVELAAKNARMPDVVRNPDDVKTLQEQRDKAAQAAQQNAQQQGAPQGGNGGANPEELQIRREILEFQKVKHGDEMKLRLSDMANKLQMSEQALRAKLGMQRSDQDHSNRITSLEARAKATIDPNEQIAGAGQ